MKATWEFVKLIPLFSKSLRLRDSHVKDKHASDTWIEKSSYPPKYSSSCQPYLL
jgi:hypothetical protein